MKRVVKLIAVDNRYKGSTYPFIPVYDIGLGTYRTGQHIDPKDPDTLGNLTLEEMTGKKELSPEKRKKFPYVIDPKATYNLHNGMEWDLTVDEDGRSLNAKDVAIEHFVRAEGWMVAPQRSKVIPRKHYFYIKDEIFEAKERVSNSEISYNAEKFVREGLTPEGLRDVGLVLNYKVKEFIYEPNTTTELMLKDKVLELCKTKPQKVLECKEPGTEDDIYILKLVLHGLITQRGTDFYDGSRFIGKDLDDVKKEIKLEENRAKVSKWNRILSEKEGRMLKTNEELSEKEKEKLSDAEDVFEKHSGKSLQQLKMHAGKKKYPKEEWEDLNDQEAMLGYIVKKES